MADVNINDMQNIVKKTLKTIENSKSEIYNIVEQGRAQVDRIRAELDAIKEETKQCIEAVDNLEHKDKLMRKKLASVSSQFDKYTEKDIKEAYDEASKIRIEYHTKIHKEKRLREKRTEKEFSLRDAERILESGNKLIHQVSTAINYLSDSKSGEQVSGIRVLEAQEEERKRLSREIHDGPAQSLSNIVFKAEICKMVVQKDLQQGLTELDELKDAVRSTLNEIRAIIYDLRPMSIDDIGLLPTIDKMIHEFSDMTGIKVKYVPTELKVDLDNIIELAIFRLIQENLNNIKKHANAKRVNLNLEFGMKYLRIKIEDNGEGFNFEDKYRLAKESGNSFGLLGMIERVENLNGDIEIDSAEGEGTVVTIELPVTKEVMMDGQ